MVVFFWTKPDEILSDGSPAALLFSADYFCHTELILLQRTNIAPAIRHSLAQLHPDFSLSLSLIMDEMSDVQKLIFVCVFVCANAAPTPPNPLFLCFA